MIASKWHTHVNILFPIPMLEDEDEENIRSRERGREYLRRRFERRMLDKENARGGEC